MTKKRILLVEDETITRSFLTSIIESLGYQVHACENGEQAVDQIGKFLPDLVITDIMMPEFSGLQLLNFIQKKTKHKVPVLLISTLDELTMSDMCSDIGAAGFLTKPPSKNEIDDKIKMALGI